MNKVNYSKTSVDFQNLPEWITLLKDELNLKAVGIGLIHIKAGKGYQFLHQHQKQEEIYFILNGNGILYIDGEEISISEGDIIKIDPQGRRALKALKENDLIAICVGGIQVEGFPKNPDSKPLIDDGIPDYDEPPPWYKNNREVLNLLKKLKEKRKNQPP